MNCLKTNVQTSGTLLLVIAAFYCDDAAWINFTRISTVCLEDHFSYDLGHPGTYPFLCSEARGKLSNRLKVQTFADWMEFRAPQFRVQSDLKRGSNAYMMAASGLPVPPPRMGWVQNLRFSYIFMEPAKTHGIYIVLTSSASETVVLAAFCNTTLYTTTLIVLLLQKQQQLLLLLPLLRTTTYYYVLLRTSYTYYVLRTTTYYVYVLRTTYHYYVLRTTTTYYYVLLRTTTYYYVLRIRTTYYYVRLRTTTYDYVRLRTTT